MRRLNAMYEAAIISISANEERRKAASQLNRGVRNRSVTPIESHETVEINEAASR